MATNIAHLVSELEFITYNLFKVWNSGNGTTHCWTILHLNSSNVCNLSYVPKIILCTKTVVNPNQSLHHTERRKNERKMLFTKQSCIMLKWMIIYDRTIVINIRRHWDISKIIVNKFITVCNPTGSDEVPQNKETIIYYLNLL